MPSWQWVSYLREKAKYNYICSVKACDSNVFALLHNADIIGVVTLSNCPYTYTTLYNKMHRMQSTPHNIWHCLETHIKNVHSTKCNRAVSQGKLWVYNNQLTWSYLIQTGLLILRIVSTDSDSHTGYHTTSIHPSDSQIEDDLHCSRYLCERVLETKKYQH